MICNDADDYLKHSGKKLPSGIILPANDNLQASINTSTYLNNSIKPLAVSADVPNMVGALSVFSLHQHTINLINEHQQLITLHRYGSGFSPMGWVLKSDHFDFIKTIISTGKVTLSQLANGNLLIDTIELSRNTHQYVLQLNSSSQTTIDKKFVANFLQQVTQSTGLFGELRHNIGASKAPQLISLCEQITRLMNSQTADITPFIGLGPGLTPSFDDTIIGIIAILSSDVSYSEPMNRLRKAMLSLPLTSLTTTISATFLNYALQQKFSLQILQVINTLNQHRYYHSSINNILHYGHTSGADLLLGMWLGIDCFLIKD